MNTRVLKLCLTYTVSTINQETGKDNAGLKFSWIVKRNFVLEIEENRSTGRKYNACKSFLRYKICSTELCWWLFHNRLWGDFWTDANSPLNFGLPSPPWCKIIYAEVDTRGSQESISPTFYAQLFRAEFSREAFLCLQ